MPSPLKALWQRWRRPPAAQPQLLILGAQKAGTTTLFDMLDGVGPFKGSTTKEVGFFSKDLFFNKGMDWYGEHFAQAGTSGIGFEATPEYLYYDFVARRVQEHLPQARFVVLLREPAARCLSAWNMFRSFNQHQPQAIYDHFTQWSNPDVRETMRQLLFTSEFPSFEQSVDTELAAMADPSAVSEPSFVRRGLYADQIDRYLKLFDRNRFLFLEQRELNEPRMVADAIGSLMDVRIDPQALKVQASNQGDYGRPDAAVDATMARLRDFYRPHNERLFQIIGRRFDWS
ncbi:MAG: sulfotransferase domain-containing protein [Burkholderiaceae bacterium]